MDGYIETGVITSEQVEDASNELHQHTHNTLGETSSEENVTALDFVQSAITRRNLEKRIEKVESYVGEVKQSPLLGVASKNALNDTANKNGSQIMPVRRVIAEKLQGTPTAAAIVAGVPGKNPDISSWKNTARIAFQRIYSKLNMDIKRCFDYCSIFPRRSKLRRVDLVCMWTGQRLVKTRCATEDMEDVADGYIEALVSHSFLQREGTCSDIDCFTIPDLVHDFLDEVIGSDYFRIENGMGQRRERWKGDVPRDVRHLFVHNYDAKLITEKIIGLENLRTLIIYVVERGTTVEKEVIENICDRLPKLRVLAVAFSQERYPIELPIEFCVPESISHLKRLCYLAFRTSYSCTVIVPSALAKLQRIQLLDFGDGKILEFTFSDLINLRHIFCGDMEFSNIGRMVALQMLPQFRVSNEQGYEINQLRDLNKLCGSLVIRGLENVNSKEEAVEANLAAKECLTHVTLSWGCDTRCSQEVGAEVLEGLCPPLGLESLAICNYRGLRYPDWMVGKQNGGPKDLKNLELECCFQPGPAPELGAFIHLRVLSLQSCSWDALSINIEYLASLQSLDIVNCPNIRSLPTLPQSLQEISIRRCNDAFLKSCERVGHPNWQKIEHVPTKKISKT
ncbi:hypothetical protein CFC21_004623 [Triticum aestivum]|uniref:NB-ARC domain-containing protein n=2 Tax=Triticum aestivum TaxID=4565 RepID=A0A9R1D7Y3_WHEAT|nr:hypothetical protein CFC21_004623 [Triticum aestivum]